MSENAKEATFPNPLQIQMGEGRILFSKFRDGDDGGIIIQDTGEPHEIGMISPEPEEPVYYPQEGDIFLRFGKVESAECLRDVLNEVIDDWKQRKNESLFVYGKNPEVSGLSRTAREANVSNAFEAIRCAMIDDPQDLAWTWHCNVAMAACDEGVDHETANRAASRFMQACFGVEAKEPG